MGIVENAQKRAAELTRAAFEKEQDQQQQEAARAALVSQNTALLTAHLEALRESAIPPLPVFIPGIMASWELPGRPLHPKGEGWLVRRNGTESSNEFWVAGFRDWETSGSDNGLFILAETVMSHDYPRVVIKQTSRWRGARGVIIGWSLAPGVGEPDPQPHPPQCLIAVGEPAFMSGKWKPFVEHGISSYQFLENHLEDGLAQHMYLLSDWRPRKTPGSGS